MKMFLMYVVLFFSIETRDCHTLENPQGNGALFIEEFQQVTFMGLYPIPDRILPLIQQNIENGLNPVEEHTHYSPSCEYWKTNSLLYMVIKSYYLNHHEQDDKKNKTILFLIKLMLLKTINQPEEFSHVVHNIITSWKTYEKQPLNQRFIHNLYALFFDILCAQNDVVLKTLFEFPVLEDSILQTLVERNYHGSIRLLKFISIDKLRLTWKKILENNQENDLRLSDYIYEEQWSPLNHPLYPNMEGFRDTVFTLLLARNCITQENLFNTLPRDILYYIINRI